MTTAVGSNATPFDDLALLRVFVRIIESGSISAAARSLRMSQPTLSRHLRTLEEKAEAPLLLRDTHRMSLTEAGHHLLADARALLSMAEEAADRLREEQAELRGHLRLGTCESVALSPVEKRSPASRALAPRSWRRGGTGHMRFQRRSR